MKMLDPGSTVREGEFASAEQAGSIPTRVVAMYNKMVTSDGRLTPIQRDDFVDRATLIMGVQTGHQLRLEKQYAAIADRAGFNPADVTVDYLGELRKPSEPIDDKKGADVVKPPTQIDLNGQPVVQRTETPTAVTDDAAAAPEIEEMTPAQLGKLDTAAMSDDDKARINARLTELGY